MKHLFIFLLMTSFFTTLSFAAETSTECLMMREANERNNPKANLAAIKPKPRIRSGSSAQ